MTGVTRAKLIVAAVAVALFVIGTRVDNATLRWAAVGLLIAAFLLRFARPRA